MEIKKMIWVHPDAKDFNPSLRYLHISYDDGDEGTYGIGGGELVTNTCDTTTPCISTGSFDDMRSSKHTTRWHNGSLLDPIIPSHSNNNIPAISIQISQSSSSSSLFLSNDDHGNQESDMDTSRRQGLQSIASSLAGAVVGYNIIGLSDPTQFVASAGEFAPGGTLVDYEVGVTAGNPQASKSRKVDNSNVVFNQDSYFKFGRAQPFIPTGSTEFPKSVPFTRVAQRYETYKKYKDRIQRGIDLVVGLKDAVDSSTYGDILDGTAPEYSIRPMGLFANGFLASENTGTTNELLLARWYINEVALDITDIKNAKSQDDARRSYDAAIAALNSYIGLINRCITSKVGEPFTQILP
eukprot:CAMPEP_0113480538 /NCGR_PEP_ID=MMETSP0014_2-20120614/21929_1 /TAXON_ID=2857 /ORGANISM="Nitzschia sp." /LENGTH=352 /DNA_ID=CAMNT_0000373975 /DNA_START=108 /DNA_END=1167 /DNA_ORIENTATION=- /assembly_acc=CAM_ASM_000159